MKRIVFLLIFLGAILPACSGKLVSPDGNIELKAGDEGCVVFYRQQPVLTLRIPVSAEDMKRAWTTKVLMKDDYAHPGDRLQFLAFARMTN